MRATRSSGISGGARPQQPARTQSQNFRPKSEWKHEDSASFLFVFLPGFIMEQLTITPDYSKGTVKVEGQRRLPNNRLLPVNETFSIPQDCDLTQMDKQFGRGILMLKMPRNIVPPQPQTTPKETQTQEEPETSMPQETLGDSTTMANLNEAVSTKLMDEKGAMTAARSDEEKLVETKGENDAEGKPTPTETPQHLVQNAAAKEEESKEQSKESAIHQAMATTHKAEEMEKEISQKSADVSDDAKGKETEKELDDAEGKEADKETEKEKANAPAKKCMVKGLNEDRKLVVNMGAAVLIIMGLGVSLFYTLRSSNSAG